MASIDSFKSGFEPDSYEHLKAMHGHIFGDIYEWAGKERIITMAKPERVLAGMSIDYGSCYQIEAKATNAIEKFKKTPWKTLETEQKAVKFADCTSALWKAHPFREGNTRTVLAFMTNLAAKYGFKMDKQLLAENPKYVRDALVLASVDEAPEKQYLAKIIKDSIERGSVKEKPWKKKLAAEKSKGRDR